MPNRTITDARHFSNYRKSGNATSKSRRALWYFRTLLALGGLVLATSTSATAAPPPPKIEYGPFEGEIAPLGSDDWTPGNISGYKEGDLVRFRLTLSSLTGIQDGHIFIAFTSDQACRFFAFEDPTAIAVDFDTADDDIDPDTEVTAMLEGFLGQSGDNAVADFHVESSSPSVSIVRLNFTLLLADGAAGCATGSSQHVEVDSVSGDVKSTGKKSLPIPASAVAPVTDIEVLKDAPVSAEIGDPITYTLIVTNLDQSTTAETVVVTDMLPGGVTFVSGSWTKTSPSGGDTCSLSIDGMTVTCELGDLAGGATATVTINVTVNNDVALCETTLVNSASVSTTTLESETGNNSAQAFTTVVDPCQGTLIVIKHVINNSGGTAVAGDFTMTVDDPGTNPASFAGEEAPGTMVTVDPGAYSVSETGPSGYAESQSADCTGSLAIGETKTCTITNDDIAPKLIVIKHVINNSGGTAVAGDFTMTVDDPGTNPASFPGAEAPGTEVIVDPGAYSVSETGPSGYAESQSADCTGSLAIGETKTCTITNDDIQPPSQGLCPAGSICAVNDVNTLDSRIFKYIPSPTDCGPLRLGANFEGLESVGGVLYAASGETSGAFASHPGGFYRVDFDDCDTTRIGDTGFDDVEALAVNPLDGTMWGFGEDEGLFTVDLTDGDGTLRRASSKKIEGLTWSLDGLRLYGVGDNKLWRLNCAAPVPPAPSNCSAGLWVLVTDDLPGDEFEGLETSRDPNDPAGHDVVIMANHGNGTLFWWDVNAGAEIVSRRLSTGGRNDVEGIVVCK